jgi:hypothetical protein
MLEIGWRISSREWAREQMGSPSQVAGSRVERGRESREAKELQLQIRAAIPETRHQRSQRAR